MNRVRGVKNILDYVDSVKGTYLVSKFHILYRDFTYNTFIISLYS